MARLKLNLPTGLAVEKPIITAFNVDNNTYLILDAENIGSMGLPIILVCKIENQKVIKIVDPNEWQQAKNYLKGIIAGNAMNYVTVASELAADEVYYTQLTLPVASFDIIKNAYNVPAENVNMSSESPVIDTPVVDINSTTETDASELPNSEEEQPVVPDLPVIDIPGVAENNTEETSVNESPVIPDIPETGSVGQVDFSDTKEAFMKACENMFDALVTKFQDQINNK